MEGVENMDEHKDSRESISERSYKNLTDRLGTSMDELTERVHVTVRDIPGALMNIETNLEIEKTSDGMYSKFDALIPPLLQWKKEKIERIETLERNYNEIFANWKSAELQRQKDVAEIESLKNQIMIQSTYCANVGAVLGRLVWRASSELAMINFWLSEPPQEKILGNFLEIADGAIAVFFKAYDEIRLPKTRDEYKFAMALLGTLANVSSSPEGRQLIIENAAGKRLVKNLVTFLPRFPTHPGFPIKKLILLTLFNMCVNNSCLRYLFELQVGRVVVHCLDEPNVDEIQQLGLNLLQAIIYDLEPGLCGELFEIVPIEKIQKIARTGHNKTCSLAREILDHLASQDN